MMWLLEHRWVLYLIIYVIVVLILTFIAFILAAFEYEHYLNSPFRGGKKIPYKKAIRIYLTSLYVVIILLTLFGYGVVELFDHIDVAVKWIMCIGTPVLAAAAAYMNSKDEKYLFLKIKEFIEGFLTIFTILYIIAGGVGYYFLIQAMV